MPFDGAFLDKLNTELRGTLIGSRADKIHQPSSDELVFFMRSAGGTKKLTLDLSASPRVYISAENPENPPVPPRFCTVLRKYLTGAKLTDILSHGLERVTTLVFETRNEMGDTVHPRLVLELISGRANAILTSEDGRITDALRRSDLETEERIIQSGALYRLPDGTGKLDFRAESPERLADAVIATGDELWHAVLTVTAGISPAAARYIAASVTDDTTARVNDGMREGLIAAFSGFKKSFLSDTRPSLMLTDGKPSDFYWMPLAPNAIALPSLCEMLDGFYSEKQAREQAAAKTGELMRFLTTLRARLARKTDARRRDLDACRDVDDLRICGELIKANLHLVEKGASFAELPDYYAEDMAVRRIRLDPALSPAENAAKYFKEYKKKTAARGMLDRLIAESTAETEYIESVIEELSRATCAAEVEAIRAELCEAGYLRSRGKGRSRAPAPAPLCFRTPSGFKVSVGRNNTENDLLTLHTAGKNDLWFHTKTTHGSHVILFTEGREPDEESIRFAAELAAYHSKARSSSGVAVDYTRIRYVKKPSGAKAGMVIYTDQHTVYVTPPEDIHLYK